MTSEHDDKFAAPPNEGNDFLISVKGEQVSLSYLQASQGPTFSEKLVSRVKRRFVELSGMKISSLRLNNPCGPSVPSTGLLENIADYRLSRPSLRQLLSPYLCQDSLRRLLYDYQIEGVEWLKNRPHRLLADDMGLGKSAQVIVAFRELLTAGELDFAIIVSPVNLCANWQREFRRWAPELATLVCRPDSQQKTEAWNAVAGRYHAIITNYEQLRDCPDILQKHRWNILVVADEAHRLRNPKSQLSRGFRQVKAERVWALTGTPLEKNADDIQGLLLAITGTSTIPAGASPRMVRAILAPKLLRRTKQEVLRELPESIDKTEWLELQGEQLAEYRRTERRFRQGHEPILALFNLLRTICDYHPETKQSVKADFTVELVDRIRDAGEKCVIFSYLLTPLDIVSERLSRSFGRDCFSRIDGSMLAQDRDEEVVRFKQDSRRSCILISTFAGSEGLTLTEANHVIFFNRWWNPSLNRQARDRVLRIGQRKGVTVHNLVAANTMEEKLEDLLSEKSNLFGTVIERPETGESGDTVMKLLWSSENREQ